MLRLKLFLMVAPVKDPDITRETLDMFDLLEKINRKFYRQYKTFILRLIRYYCDHRKFTQKQINAMRFLINGS